MLSDEDRPDPVAAADERRRRNLKCFRPIEVHSGQRQITPLPVIDSFTHLAGRPRRRKDSLWSVTEETGVPAAELAVAVATEARVRRAGDVASFVKAIRKVYRGVVSPSESADTLSSRQLPSNCLVSEIVRVSDGRTDGLTD